MSPLAFDKQGKPFSWHKRTAKLRVRLFRNPSARGTCCQVLDAAGAPLFVDADIEYAEFRRVAGVPGLYRLDQCDEDGVELEDAAPAYVSIEQLRNAGGGSESAQAGEVNALVIIERLVAVHADVMRTMTMQHAAMLAASAEVMRAPYRPMPLAPAPELRNAETADQSDDEDEDDDAEEALDASSPFAPMLSMLEPHLPRLGAFLYQKLVEFFRHASTMAPAAPSAPVSPAVIAAAPAARHTPARPVDGAAGDDGEAELDDEVSSEVATEPTDVAAPEPTRNAPPAPTSEQLAHLFAVRERLSPAEQALVEHVLQRMPPELMTQYLGTLSAMSIDDATALVRSLIAQARPERGTRPR